MQPVEQYSTEPAERPSTASLPRLYRGRPVLAAFIAVLVELVVIGAVDNQGVAGKLTDPLNDPSRVFADYTRGAINAAVTYWWRFAPADGQATHVWAAQFAAIGVLVAITWLGALAVARGSVTFGRVWVGVWALVAAAAPVSIMVRNVLVTPTAPGPAESKIGQAVYGFDAFGPVVVAGLVLGLVTGLVTAAVSVSSRRQVAAAPLAGAAGSAEQDEYFDDSFARQYPPPQPYQPKPWGEAQWQTTQLPAAPPEQAPPPPWPPEHSAPAWPPAPAAPTAQSEQQWAAEQPTQQWAAEQHTEAIPAVPTEERGVATGPAGQDAPTEQAWRVPLDEPMVEQDIAEQAHEEQAHEEQAHEEQAPSRPPAGPPAEGDGGGRR